MNYLFLMNIGPVQDFIASARRTRDLAFGSWFLSELSRAAAFEIVKQNGLSSLIFPAPAEEQMLTPNYKKFLVANKIIARVRQSPQELGEHTRLAVMARLHDLRDDAYRGVPLADGQRTIAEVQVDDLPEILWAALPFDEQNYQETRKQLEALMAARKSTRNFSQVSWGDFVPKSSISGQLESVIPEPAYLSARDLYENYGAGSAERLSGVDLLKRRGVTAYGEHFPSTSHMATLPFLERLRVLENQDIEAARRAWNDYISAVQELAFSLQLEHTPKYHPILGDYDGSMLFESRLVDVLYAPGEAKTRGTQIQKAKRALEGFYQKLDQQFSALGFSPGERPDPYYAFLQADGDGMGELIDAQARQGPEQHQQLSQTLAGFAKQVRTIVEEEYRGALVYAGGDDVVAFLPLDTALECANQLAETFDTMMRKFEFKDRQGQERIPSLSAGIAIVHHLDSLHRVRQLAKQAEDRAKGLPGKNALSITLSKRSGEDYSIRGHWQDLRNSLPRLIDFYRKGAVPVGTAYELRELVLRLGISMDEARMGDLKQAIHPYGEVIKWDALRVITRKLNVPHGKFPPDQTEEIERFFKAWLGIEPVPIDELIVAQVLADATKLAAPEKERSRV